MTTDAPAPCAWHSQRFRCGDQVDESAPHWNVRQIRGPDLVESVDNEIPQQVRIDPVFRMRLASVAFAVDGLDSHLGHQRADMATACRNIFQTEQSGILAGDGGYYVAERTSVLLTL